MTLEGKARAFATAAHGAVGQTRKYTGEPYIVHPAAVVEIVRSVSHTQEMLCAAWLHDVVEDTEVTILDITQEFGEDIASLVDELTDVSKPEDGNRKVRKELDRQHTARASPHAKTIKLADLLDNTKSIVKHDPAFATRYMREKAALLKVLKEGDETLWVRAKKEIAIFYERRGPSPQASEGKTS